MLLSGSQVKGSRQSVRCKLMCEEIASTYVLISFGARCPSFGYVAFQFPIFYYALFIFIF